MDHHLLAGRAPAAREARRPRRRRCAAQSRKFGITRMSRVIAELAEVSAFRLSDTAVTPSDCSMQNATVSEYDRSLPSSVMSVPCSVVMTARHASPPGRRQNLPRQVRRGRVRDRVVGVDDVETARRATPARSCSPATAGTAARETADSSASRRGGMSGRAGSRRAGRRVAAQDVDVVAARGQRLARARSR